MEEVSRLTRDEADCPYAPFFITFFVCDVFWWASVLRYNRAAAYPRR